MILYLYQLDKSWMIGYVTWKQCLNLIYSTFSRNSLSYFGDDLRVLSIERLGDPSVQQCIWDSAMLADFPRAARMREYFDDLVRQSTNC